MAAGNSSGDSHVVVTVTGPEDQLAAFVEACKAIETLGQVGASRDVIVPVDGDGAASLRFDYGETDVSEIEAPEIDGDDVRITGIGY